MCGVQWLKGTVVPHHIGAMDDRKPPLTHGSQDAKHSQKEVLLVSASTMARPEGEAMNMARPEGGKCPLRSMGTDQPPQLSREAERHPQLSRHAERCHQQSGVGGQWCPCQFGVDTDWLREPLPAPCKTPSSSSGSSIVWESTPCARGLSLPLEATTLASGIGIVSEASPSASGVSTSVRLLSVFSHVRPVNTKNSLGEQHYELTRSSSLWFSLICLFWACKHWRNSTASKVRSCFLPVTGAEADASTKYLFTADKVKDKIQ